MLFFRKNEKQEEMLLFDWVKSLPEPFCTELAVLFKEMAERKTLEAKIYKAMDSLEALIQHNESDISTWLPLEYDLQMTYGNDKTDFSEYMKSLRELVRNDSVEKIKQKES